MRSYSNTLDERVCKRLREIRRLLNQRMSAMAAGEVLDKQSDKRAHDAALFLREVRRFLDGRTKTINFHPERAARPMKSIRRRPGISAARPSSR